MNVRWTDHAEEDLDAIHAFIAQDSLSHANRMIDKITARSKQIGTFPQSGRQVPGFGLPQIREVREGSYRIIYHILPEGVEVISILHASRDVLRSE